MDYADLLSRLEIFFSEVCYSALLKAVQDREALVVDFSDIEKFDVDVADCLLETPDEFFKASEEAMRNVDVGEELESQIHFRIMGLPESQVVSIKNLRSKHLKKFIAVKGIIKQASEVRPEIVLATFECRACGERIMMLQEEQDLTTPYMCECGNKRGFEMVERKMVDIQRLEVEEAPEALEGSAQARKIGVYIKNDLVDPKFQRRVVPGSKIVITGVLDDIPIKTDKGKESKRRDIYIDGNYVEPIEFEFEEIEVSAKDEKMIKELAANPKIFDLLADSIAPSIYGYRDIKQAISLQLFGGVRKVRPDGVVTRGDIHVLLVGDPGSGKSQLLKYTSGLAPKARYVVGKSASGAGLCVAPNSLILNNNGLREIDGFVEENFKEASAVEELPGALSCDYGCEAVGLDGQLKLSESKVDKVWRIKAPEEMVNVVTRSGKEICLTGNTSLIRIKNGKVEWVRAADLGKMDFVASTRIMPEGSLRCFPAIKLLLGNKNIRIKNDVSERFSKITDALAEKYGSIQNIGKSVGVSRDRLYLWRTHKYYHGIPLHLFVKLGMESGASLDDLALDVKGVFLRNGKNVRMPVNIVDKDIAYLAGLMLGDGCVQLSSERVCMRLCSADESLLKKAEEILFDVFGINALEVDDGERVPNIRFSHMPVYYVLKAFGLSDKKQEITLSHLLTEMPNEVIASLLSGLFDTDGYVSKVGSVHVGMSSICRNLVKRVQLCLLKFGIHSGVRERKVAGKVSQGKTFNSRPIISRHDQYYIEIRGKGNLELFRNEIGFKLDRKSKVLDEVIKGIPRANTNVDVIPEIVIDSNKIRAKGMARRMGYLSRSNISREMLKSVLRESEGCDDFLEMLADSGVFWEKIVDVSYFKPDYEFVYDFSVREHHNFIANGFFVHNTATVVKDEFMKGWALEAGALVLANKGLVAIDELDKMSTEDRSSMHEVAEQQTVTVSKANIQATLNAQTTILAAANPKFGRFDPYQSLPEQIDIPDTLLSRFDLIFPIRDVPNKEKDTLLVRHILKMHENPEIQNPPLDSETLRKYISYAKANVKPKLTKPARTVIEKFYVGLRSKYAGGDEVAPVPIGARQLEALVRLSEASAKVRLSDTVKKEDAQRAIKLLTDCLMQVGIDPETGKFDIDRLESGTTSTQRNKIKIILTLVSEMQKDSADKSVLIEDIKAAAEEQGLEDAEEIIQKLKREGELFEPKHGHIRRV